MAAMLSPESSERPAAARTRRLSVVSFISNDKVPMRVEPKFGRQLGTVGPARQASAASNVSTASSWSMGSRPAASMVALRSRIMATLEKSISLIQHYDQTYLQDPDDDFQGIYQEFVRQLIARIGYKNDLTNCEQLDAVIMRKFKSEPTVAKRADFRSLTVVCARARGFRELVSQVRMRLDEVHDYADTFCVTFSQENEGLSFESLENYENTKTHCLKEIYNNMENVNASMDELKDISPLSIYLDQYSRVLHYIEHVVRCLRCIAVNLRKWVVGDEQYEKGLEKEISFLRQRASQMSDARLTVSNLRYEVKARTPNASGKLRKTELSFTKSRVVLQKLRDKQKSLNHILSENQERQKKVKLELSGLDRQSARKQKLASFTSLTPNIDKVREQLTALQIQEDLLLLDHSNNKQEIAAVTKEMHCLEMDMTKRKKSVEKVVERVQEHSNKLKSHEQTTTNVHHKLRVLKKLQSLKRNPETIRKIEFHMINIDYKEAMQTAIHQVAVKIGTGWPEIYLKLPFMPPRDEKTRRADIEALQKVGVSSDKSQAELGVMAFEKWAKRSTAATVNELVFAGKLLIERSQRKESAKKSKYTIPRTKKRFQNLKEKKTVKYV